MHLLQNMRLKTCAYGSNVNVVRGRFYETFQHENLTCIYTKVSEHENFQIYGTQACILLLYRYLMV